MPKRISFLRFLSTLHSLAFQLNITATPEGGERDTFPSMLYCNNLSLETSIAQLLSFYIGFQVV